MSVVLAYGLQYPSLTLKLHNENKELYEAVKIDILIKEYNKGFRCSKWNKPTKKGTHARFKVIKDKEDNSKIFESIIEYVNSFNIEFNKKLEIRKEA